MGRLDYRIFYRRNLPHIQPPGATLFITFRLAGSIPIQALQRLAEEWCRVETELARISDPKEKAKRTYLEQRRFFGKWDALLDKAREGPFWLRDPRIATLVADSLLYRDGKVYELDAFCIMPNHVHMVCRPLKKADGSYHSLAAIMHSLKRYTARQANQLLGRRGAFWQHENYDHIVRDSKEWERIIAYVLNNPVKAGLVERWEDWEWVYYAHR